MTRIYAIRDDAAEYFLPPFFAENDNHAKRMFISSLGDSFPYRADFKLFHLGEFDDNNGSIHHVSPNCVLAGLSIGVELDPRVAPQKTEVKS